MQLASAETLPHPPQHVAIIMDGNGRWAKARGLPRVMGHKKGAEAVRRTVEAAADIGISYLTLFGFSSENWKRPQSEVNDLMGLLRIYLKNELEELDRNAVRLRVIGATGALPADIQALISEAEKRTRDNARICVTIALSYGGRMEIVEATRALAARCAEGTLDPASIDETLFGDHLFTAGLPDPDLLIRTSGEQRISNFLLYQCAYSEFVFLDVLWPDFGREDLIGALDVFSRRERRFGARLQPA